MNERLRVALVVIGLVGMAAVSIAAMAFLRAQEPRSPAVAVQSPAAPSGTATGTLSPPATTTPPPLSSPEMDFQERTYLAEQRVFDQDINAQADFQQGLGVVIQTYARSWIAKNPEFKVRFDRLESDKEKLITRKVVEAGRDPKTTTYNPQTKQFVAKAANIPVVPAK
jgi:hypothetical protein